MPNQIPDMDSPHNVAAPGFSTNIAMTVTEVGTHVQTNKTKQKRLRYTLHNQIHLEIKQNETSKVILLVQTKTCCVGTHRSIRVINLALIYLIPLQHSFLPKPFKAFNDGECTDTETNEFKDLMDADPELYPDSRGTQYSLNACIVKRTHLEVAAVCNCTALAGLRKYIITIIKVSQLKSHNMRASRSLIKQVWLISWYRPPCR